MLEVTFKETQEIGAIRAQGLLAFAKANIPERLFLCVLTLAACIFLVSKGWITRDNWPALAFTSMLPLLMTTGYASMALPFESSCRTWTIDPQNIRMKSLGLRATCNVDGIVEWWVADNTKVPGQSIVGFVWKKWYTGIARHRIYVPADINVEEIVGCLRGHGNQVKPPNQAL